VLEALPSVLESEVVSERNHDVALGLVSQGDLLHVVNQRSHPLVGVEIGQCGVILYRAVIVVVLVPLESLWGAVISIHNVTKDLLFFTEVV
jgi:hypothetical protein